MVRRWGVAVLATVLATGLNPSHAIATPACATLPTPLPAPDPHAGEPGGGHPNATYFPDIFIDSATQAKLHSALYLPTGATSATPVPVVLMTHGGGQTMA